MLLLFNQVLKSPVQKLLLKQYGIGAQKSVLEEKKCRRSTEQRLKESDDRPSSDRRKTNYFKTNADETVVTLTRAVHYRTQKNKVILLHYRARAVGYELKILQGSEGLCRLYGQ